ncbi:MAG: phosphotransferase [Myxococcales bacterium]
MDAAFQNLASRLGGTLLRRALLTGGVSARVELLELSLAHGEVRRVVFRQHGAAGWKPNPSDVTRQEFELLGALSSRGLPVPTPLFLVGADDGFGSPGFVMEWCEGTSTIADPDEAWPQLAAFLATLHAVPLDLVPELPGREDPVEGLRTYASRLPAGLLRLLDEGLPPRAPRRTLLHGDVWPGNLLWRDGALVAVLEGTMAA